MPHRSLGVFAMGTLVLMTVASTQAQDGGSARKVGLNGGFSASVSHYNSNRDVQARDPVTWLLSGNATVQFRKWSMPFSATVSRQRQDISTPTFARIGVSPTWGWGKAHLGYRSMRFSQFTVGGTTFLGAGLELNPGLFRFGILGGRFAEAREDDQVEGIRARYERVGYGFKLGFGSSSNYFDVIMFRAADDSTSIETEPEDPETTPSENLVLGFDLNISPIQSLSFFFEGAVSALNRDIRAEEIETDVASIITDLFQPRESAQANLAARAGIDINQTFWGIKAEYLWVEPDYQTLGSYFFNTDVQSITVSPRFAVARGRVNVSLSGGYSRNNLYDDLLQTTERLIGSANLNLRISRAFRIGAIYSNYSSDQSAGLVESTDSTRVTNVSQNVMLTPQFQWGRETRHNLSLRASVQDYQQTSLFTGFDNDTQTRNVGLNYSVYFTASDFRIRLSATNLDSETPSSDIGTRSLSAGLSKGFLDGLFSLDLRVGLRRRERGDEDASTNVTGNVGLNVSPSRFDSFSVRSQFTNRSGVNTDEDSLREFMTTFTYSRRFAI